MTSILSRLAQTVICILIAMFAATTCRAQVGMTTVANPSGGKIAYGQVEGQTTEAGAMGAVLRSIHSQYGNKPQVGKLFSVHGTESVACFFSVNKSKPSPGQLAGMLIVTKATTDHVEAAVLSDDASHFSSSLSPMLKTLFGVWHPLASAQGPSAAGSAPVPVLKKFTLSDRSAWVSLPDGYEVSPQSAGGTILAQGPNGENIALGLTFMAGDLNNPHMRQTYEMVQRGGLRNTVYANANYYPYGQDLAKTMIALVNMTRQKRGQPAADFQSIDESPFQSQPPTKCVHITGKIDAKDGKGLREMNTVYCVNPPSPMGNYMSVAYHTAVPVQVADKERATMAAILESFGVDMSVVNREASAIAAPAIAQIHAIGKAAADQAAAAHERNDIQNSSVYQHWDDMDRRSKEFSNYQLGYTVIDDLQNNAHGTFWNADADAIVKSDPARYEYVSAPDYWKGIDY